jgi:hypothetical protein
MAATVNDQIIDAITLTSVQVVGMSPSVAMGYLYQATAQALGNAANNATIAQHNANIVDNATTSTGAAIIMHLAPKS